MIKIGDWVIANTLCNARSNSRQKVLALVVDAHIYKDIYLILIPKGHFSSGWWEFRTQMLKNNNFPKYFKYQFDSYEIPKQYLEEITDETK